MRQTLKSMILAAMLVLGSQAAWAQVPPDGQPAALTPAQWADPVDGVYNAQDDQGALAAYQSAPDKTSLELNLAFVEKMVELGMPEKATDQAEVIIAAQPADGLACAVIAFNDARLGNMAEAVAGITLAARSLPDDEFVVRTAAQLAAWLDQRPAGVEIHDAVVEAFQEVRQKIAAQQTFADAYTEAQTAYKELAAAQAQAAPLGGDQAVQPDAQVLQPAVAQAIQPAPAAVTYVTPTTVVYDPYAYETVYQSYYLPQWYGSYMMAPAVPTYLYGGPAYNGFWWSTFYGSAWSGSYAYGYGYGNYWSPGLVVFVGYFHHGGVYVGHCGRHEVIIDRGHDIYVGHTRTEYVGHERRMIVEDAHRVRQGDDGRRVADARPQRLEIAGGRVVDRTPRINDMLARPTHDRSDRLVQQARDLSTAGRTALPGRTAAVRGAVRPQPLAAESAGRTQPVRATPVPPVTPVTAVRRDAPDARTPVQAANPRTDGRITVGQPQPITRTRRDGATDGTRTALTDQRPTTSILPAAGPVKSRAPLAARTISAGGKSDAGVTAPAPTVTARSDSTVTFIPGPRTDASAGRGTGVADRSPAPVTTVVDSNTRLTATPATPAVRPVPPTDAAPTDRTARARTRVDIPDWARPGAQPAPATPSARQPVAPAAVAAPAFTPIPAGRSPAAVPQPPARSLQASPRPTAAPMPSAPPPPAVRTAPTVISAPAPAPSPAAPSRSDDCPRGRAVSDDSPRGRSDSSASPTPGRDGPVGAAPSSESSDRAERLEQRRGR